MEHGNKNTPVEEILDSLTGMRRAEAPSFLYTRVAARLEAAEKTAPWPLIGKPAFSFTVLALLIAINAVAFMRYVRHDNSSAATVSGIQRFASEYQLDGSSVYDTKSSLPNE